MSTNNDVYEKSWDALQGEERAEAGGGGIIAVCRVHAGFKVYAPDMPPAESFFPYTPGNEAEKEEARSRARRLSQETGGARFAFHIELRALREGALSRGEPVTWQADCRCFGTDAYTDGWHEVLKPSLQHNRIPLPWQGWARIGFAPDPHWQRKLDKYLKDTGKLLDDLSDDEKREAGMKEKDQEGHPRMPQVAYIVETFVSKEEAYAAAGTDEAAVETATDEAIPEWLVDFAKQQVEAGKKVAEIAAEVGKPVSLVIKALEQEG